MFPNVMYVSRDLRGLQLPLEDLMLSIFTPCVKFFWGGGSIQPQFSVNTGREAPDLGNKKLRGGPLHLCASQLTKPSFGGCSGEARSY